MKLAFIYGPFCLGSPDRAFDLNNLWSDRRGLTGSEISYFKLAKNMSDRGHHVSLYSFFKNSSISEWNGMIIRNFEDMYDMDSNTDFALSWNEAEVFRSFTRNVKRAVNLQINSFTHCKPGMERFVDFWTSPSFAHREMILSKSHSVGNDFFQPSTYIPKPEDWEVLTNGVDIHGYSKLINHFPKNQKQVIWASSPDRGLHWLLQMWPRIKNKVPDATLRIFYQLERWLSHFLNIEDCDEPTIMEQKNRAQYINNALQRLNDHGIEVIGSVSRTDIAEQMIRSSVLAYPCDPVCWTEGFSVTLMEACASRTVPVTTGVDALGSIYGSLPTVVSDPVSDHIDEFIDLVCRSLLDSEFRKKVCDSAQDLASHYSWDNVGRELQSILERRL